MLNMLDRLRTRSKGESGFTLVELLVVMLILGILAAIAIPAFFSQRDKGKDANAKSTVNTAQTAIETYATDNNGSYAGANGDLTKLTAVEPTLTGSGVTVAATSDTYTVTATSGTGNTFSISRAGTGAVTYPCVGTSKPNAGCPTSTNDWKP